MEVRRRLHVHLSEVRDERVTNLAKRYLNESHPLAASNLSGPAFVASIKEAGDRRFKHYVELTGAIGAARMR